MPTPINDDSFVAQYIRAIENPDSIGFREGKWYQPTRRGYDSNNRGFGVDVRYNKDARKLTEGRKGRWLSEEEERDLRNKHIGYSLDILGKWTPKVVKKLSEVKQAMATGILYRGDGVGSIINNSVMRDAYWGGTDADFQQAVSDFYQQKRLSERARNHNTFLDNPPSPIPLVNWEEEVATFKPEVQYLEGGQLRHKSWNDLSMAERSEMIGVAVRNGITNLQEIRQKYNEFAEGGSIHIKPENRGKFTVLKERTGHSATWFKEHGTPAQRKTATFALNARHWKHDLGGPLVEAAMAHQYGDGGREEKKNNFWIN